jgi:hypothetical protein
MGERESYRAAREARTSAKGTSPPSAEHEKALAKALGAAYYHELHVEPAGPTSSTRRPGATAAEDEAAGPAADTEAATA